MGDLGKEEQGLTKEPSAEARWDAVMRADRRPLIAGIRSDEATFETYNTDSGGVMLVMRPHGVPIGDDREVGWRLTLAEVDGLCMLLAETLETLA